MSDTQTTQTGARPTKRPRTVEVRGYKFALNVSLVGIEPEQLTIMHVRSGLHESWPAGLLGHLTTVTDLGARSLVIWEDEAQELQYFHETALEMVTNSVPEIISEQPGRQLGDFVFEGHPLHRLMITSELRAFADIGVDLDHSSITALGGEPVLVSINFEGITPERYDEAVKPLSYDKRLPDGMMLNLVEAAPDATIENQVWRSEELARQELEARYAPAVAELVGGEFEPLLEPVSRISFESAALGRALAAD